MFSAVLLLLVSLAAVAAKQCVSLNVPACPQADSAFVYVQGSLSPSSSGLSANDLLSIIVSNGSVQPFLGFNCLPSDRADDTTALNAEFFDPKDYECGKSASPMQINIPLSSSDAYGGPGVWYLGFKACDPQQCAFDLVVNLLQGACMAMEFDWIVMTEEQMRLTTRCDSATRATSKIAALLLMIALALMYI